MTTKKCKTEKVKKRICSEVTVKVWGIHAVSPDEERERLRREGLSGGGGLCGYLGANVRSRNGCGGRRSSSSSSHAGDAVFELLAETAHTYH